MSPHSMSSSTSQSPQNLHRSSSNTRLHGKMAREKTALTRMLIVDCNGIYCCISSIFQHKLCNQPGVSFCAYRLVTRQTSALSSVPSEACAQYVSISAYLPLFTLRRIRAPMAWYLEYGLMPCKRRQLQRTGLQGHNTTCQYRVRRCQARVRDSPGWGVCIVEVSSSALRFHPFQQLCKAHRVSDITVSISVRKLMTTPPLQNNSLQCAYLRMPSNAMLTMSTVPAVGLVNRPIRPLPMPLKKPSMPSSRVPNRQAVDLEPLQ